MTPVRTCVVCRTRRDDHELARAGRFPDGTWYLGRGLGRGVWWCARTDCAESLERGHVARSLRLTVSEQEVGELREVWRASKRPEL